MSGFDYIPPAGGGAPSGAAGGVLGGTYPNPSFAADMATQAELDAHIALSATDAELAAHAALATGVHGITTVRLGSDQQRTATSLADLSGLSVAIPANAEYLLTAYLIYDTAATTTGLGLSVNGPSGGVPTLLASIALRGGDSANSHVWAGTINAHDDAVTADAVSVANSKALAKLEGIYRNGANAGTLALRFASEVGSSAVNVYTGSILRLERTA